jgi:uncharacterized protein (TIGR00251 family)
MISEHIKNSRLKVIVKPGSISTGIIGFDTEKNALKVSVKSPADKNKANIELLRFLTKETGLKARIKSGQTSREKIIEFS